MLVIAQGRRRSQGLTTRESHIINTHPILSQIQEAEGERNDKLT